MIIIFLIELLISRNCNQNSFWNSFDSFATFDKVMEVTLSNGLCHTHMAGMMILTHGKKEFRIISIWSVIDAWYISDKPRQDNVAWRIHHMTRYRQIDQGNHDQLKKKILREIMDLYVAAYSHHSRWEYLY